jgi:predicted PurR-regulated permease PerM
MRERKFQARLLALLFATAVALYLCWLMLQPFVNVLAWAAVLVVFFYPIHSRPQAQQMRRIESRQLIVSHSSR